MNQRNLEWEYAEVARHTNREKEALEWAEAIFNDTAGEHPKHNRK